MRVKYVRLAAIVGVVALVAASAWWLIVAPPLIAFAVTIAAAIAWCIWLERHPENVRSSVITSVADAQQGQEQQNGGNYEYIPPPRRLTGTTDEVLQQIDDLIQGLIGLQQLVLLRHSNAPKAETRRRLHLVRSLGALLFVLVATTLASAQPAGPSSSAPQKPPESIPWQYGGFVDVAYLYDFDRPVNKLFRSRGTAWHVDDLHLNMTGVYAKKKATEKSRWGAELLVQTGKDDEIFGFSATAPNIDGSEWLRHLGLANVSYLAPTGKGLTLQGGVFPSLIGYDSLYAKDNFNYTRPWGADFTPYLMLGVNASYPFTEKLTGTFYVVNGYWHLANANSVPSSGVQLAYKATPQVMVKETVLAGPHQSNTSLEFWRFLSDTIVERRTDRLVGAFEYQFSTEQVDESEPFRAWWMTAQLPIRWNVQGPWSVAVRPEIAWDSHGRWTLAEQTVKALTTTLEYRVPYKWASTILRLEHRVDDSRGPGGGFFDDGEVSPGVPRLTPTQHLLIFGVIVTFDSPTER